MGLRKFFKKVGKVAKKALPFAAAALPFIPGVGAAASGMLSKVGDMWGGSSAQSNAPPPFMGPPEPGQPTQSIPVNGQRDPEPGFNWTGALGAIAPIASGALNYLGQKSTNVANAQQAQAQMDFQNQQTSSSYQRGVADMKAAGLNPMLAYSQGGAQSGSGASAVMGNELGAGANSAQSAYLARQQMRQSEAQIGNIDADTDLKNTTDQLQRAERLRIIATTRNLGTENEKLLRQNIGLDLSNMLESRRQDSLVRQASSAADLTRAQSAGQEHTNKRLGVEGDWWKDYGRTYLNTSKITEQANSAANVFRKFIPFTND